MLRVRPVRSRASVALLGAVSAMAVLCGQASVAWASQASIPPPTVVVPSLPATWSALGTGTLLSPDVSAGSAVIAGTEVRAQIGTVDFAGTSGAGTYATSWLSCPARGAADSSCTPAESAASQSGNPSGLSRTYAPKTDDVGRYLRFSLTVVPAGGTARTVTSDPAKDVYVLGQSATGAQPEVKAGQIPGEHGTAILKKWTIPSTSSFRAREVAVWACTSASAGQVTTREFTPSSSGCTSVPVLTAVSWVADATAVVFAIPGDAGGRYLLVSDTVTTATGPTLGLASYVVRSATVPLKGTASGSPMPTPSTTGSATPTPTPTPSASANSGSMPTMSVLAERRASAGKPYQVSVTVSPAGASGIANVRLVTRNAKARTVQTLTSVVLANGAGSSQSTITAKPGKYALIVQFVDGKTGKSLTYSRKVRVKD